MVTKEDIEKCMSENVCLLQNDVIHDIVRDLGIIQYHGDELALSLTSRNHPDKNVKVIQFYNYPVCVIGECGSIFWLSVHHWQEASKMIINSVKKSYIIDNKNFVDDGISTKTIRCDNCNKPINVDYHVNNTTCNIDCQVKALQKK